MKLTDEEMDMVAGGQSLNNKSASNSKYSVIEGANINVPSGKQAAHIECTGPEKLLEHGILRFDNQD